jgi:seryl-tRNA synthetase
LRSKTNAFTEIFAALLENNQTENGIKIPKALVPYCGFDEIN